MRNFISIVFMTMCSSAYAARESIDRVVAVVDNDVITYLELQKKAEDFLRPTESISDVAERETKRKEILAKTLEIEIGERLVTAELEANRDKLSISQTDVDRAIEQVLKSNNLNREKLKSALYSQGLSWSEYEKKLRDQLERSRLVQMTVHSKIKLDDSDVNQRCQSMQSNTNEAYQVCASHILLQIPKNASSDAKKRLYQRAIQIRTSLVNGADFSNNAMKYSDDKGAPDGSLGCFGRGEMVEAFENVAFSIEPGIISPIVQTEFGYHIIRVKERKKESVRDCSDPDTINTIRNKLYQEQFESQMDLWLKDLRKKRFVDIRL